MSNGAALAAAAAAARASASAPLDGLDGLDAPASAAGGAGSSRLVALSSTTRARRPSRRSGLTGLVIGDRASGRRSDRSNQNVRTVAGLALDADLAAHQLDELAADRQAQAGAAELARGRGVGLAEGLEEALLIARARCRCPVSTHVEAHVAAVARTRSTTLDADHDFARRR